MTAEQQLAALKVAAGDLELITAAQVRYQHRRDLLIAALIDGDNDISGRDIANAADLTEGRMYALARKVRTISPAENLLAGSIEPLRLISGRDVEIFDDDDAEYLAFNASAVDPE